MIYFDLLDKVAEVMSILRWPLVYKSYSYFSLELLFLFFCFYMPVTSRAYVAYLHNGVLEKYLLMCSFRFATIEIVSYDPGTNTITETPF